MLRSFDCKMCYMPHRIPSVVEKIKVLDRIGVQTPPQPIRELPEPMLEGASPSLADKLAEVDFQFELDAWVAEVERVYFIHVRT